MKTHTNSSQTVTISIVMLGAVLFFISLLLLPKTPSIDEEAVDVKIATQLINDGKVMEGVTMLKNVLKKDENNIDAIWQLGNLSMQSSQYEKAVNRFEKFVSITDGNDKTSGLIYLADAYFLSNQKDKAFEALTEAKKSTKDEKYLIEIDQRIEILNKK